MADSLATIPATYDYRLVGLSVVIALMASYVALDMAGRVTRAKGMVRTAWLLGGAFAMGTGIWSMHYTGMLAYRLPIPIYYHLPTVALSLLAAVLGALVGLWVVSRKRLTPGIFTAGSLLMGGGIVAMHYIGMLAIRMPAREHYDPRWVAVSAVLGPAVSAVAMRFTWQAESECYRWRFRLGSCLVMGLAMVSVHYSGMAGLTLTPSATVDDLINATHISSVSNFAIVLVTLIILAAALLTSTVDRWLSARTEEVLRLQEEATDALAQKDRMFRDLVEASPDAILVHDGRQILFTNPACLKLLRADSPGQLVGRSLLDIIHPDRREALRQHIEQRYLSGTVSPPFENILIRLDGSAVDVESVGIPFVWEDEPAHQVMLRDISERKKAEQALRDWQRRHELAQRSGLSLGWWDWELESGTLSWSEEMYRQFGYTRETFGGTLEEFLARLHPDDRPRVEAAAEEVKAGGQDYAAQFRVVRPEGGSSWLDCRGVVIHDGTRRMIGIAMDITDLISAQQAIQEGKEEYLALLSSTAEAIYGIDLNGHCTFCNPACLRLLGYESQWDLLGTNIHQLIHHSHADGAPYAQEDCALAAAAKEGRPIHSNNEILWRADGTNFLAEYWSHPMFKAGNLTGAVVTFLDVSDRKRAEEAQSRSEQMFRLIAENSADLIAVVNNSGHRIYNNPAYQRVLGLSPHELSKTVAFDQIHPDDREMVKHTAEEAIRTGVGRMIEYRMRRKDGTYASLESHGSFIRNVHGEIEAQVITARDISSRKLAAQTEKLGAIGQLAAGIAHEINTPVQYLSDNVSFLRDAWAQVEAVMEMGAPARPETPVGAAAAPPQPALATQSQEWTFLQREVPNAISQSLEGIRRISRIVGAMRKFSHSSYGEKERVDLNDALDTTLTVAHNELKHVADVGTEFLQELPRVECVPDEINQVFLNLMINAAHAMRDASRANPGLRGKLLVRTRTTADGVQIEIEDNGCGIPEHARARVFEPFFTTKQVGEGTGQGLAICHDIVVNKHGGKIWFDTELGKGTTFFVWLPLQFRGVKEEVRK